jgi:hypothetical protein
MGSINTLRILLLQIQAQSKHIELRPQFIMATQQDGSPPYGLGFTHTRDHRKQPTVLKYLNTYRAALAERPGKLPGHGPWPAERSLWSTVQLYSSTIHYDAYAATE